MNIASFIWSNLNLQGDTQANDLRPILYCYLLIICNSIEMMTRNLFVVLLLGL